MAISIADWRMVWHRVGTQDANFEISDQDQTGATYYYFGYLHSDGAWVIQRFDISTPNVILYRYATGQSAYTTAWAGRAGLTYQYFNQATVV